LGVRTSPLLSRLGKGREKRRWDGRDEGKWKGKGSGVPHLFKPTLTNNPHTFNNLAPTLAAVLSNRGRQRQAEMSTTPSVCWTMNCPRNSLSQDASDRKGTYTTRNTFDRRIIFIIYYCPRPSPLSAVNFSVPKLTSKNKSPVRLTLI